MANLRYPQPRVDRDSISLRLKLAKALVGLTRLLADIAYPDGAQELVSDLDMLMVLVCVFIGDGEGRPMTATKISHFSGLPRSTVYRRLETLIKIKKIVRRGKNYFYAKNAMNPARDDALREFISRLCTK